MTQKMTNEIMNQYSGVSLSTGIDPIAIISNNSTAENQSQMGQFIKIITHLYQFSLLKDILDFTTAKAQQNSLKFNIKDRRFFELDEGNCKTITSSSIVDIFLNAFKNNKNYVINIKKIAPDVIIHEIAHMVEQELADAFDPFIFSQIISQEIIEIKSKTGNISLLDAVKSIMIEEVENYQDSHKVSELFARYFQMLASTREVTRFGTKYSYSLMDVAKVFEKTSKYVAELLGFFYKTHNYFAIKKASESYIKDIEDIKHKWSEQKIHSFHKETKQINGVTKPIWKKSFKSIKDDPFV